ncbi:MAG TPA: metallophosphoesterase [Clostridiales bacterium]|nr:metallophosphoesterase [Clostridiales bacterium]
MIVINGKSLLEQRKNFIIYNDRLNWRNFMIFAVFTDLHYDIIYDSERRLNELFDSFKKEAVDFIVDLGDLCHSTDKNKDIINRFKEFGVPYYFNIGNHNTDYQSVDDVLKFYELNNSYYSFVYDNFKFIVLDANYIKTPDGVEAYYRKNHFDIENTAYKEILHPYLPKSELEWLENEIRNDKYYYIIFSHQSLTNGFMNRGVSNREEVRKLLEKRNERSKKVLLCMNGHDHGDDVKLINGIYYYTLNSASYIWQCIKETYNYSDEIHAKYPYLKDMILYEEALHAIVTIDENANISIKGIDGSYQNIEPENIGMPNIWNGISIKPKTSSLIIKSCN